MLIDWAGLVDRPPTGNHMPTGLVNWPYYPGGLWAAATDIAIAALVLVVAAVAVQRSVARRTGFHLDRWDAAAAVAFTGWWPLLGLHPLRFGTGFAVVASIAIVRWRARREETDERWPVRLLAVLAAVAAVAILWYVAFHPLRVASMGGSVGAGSGAHELLGVSNAGLTRVTIVGLSVPAWRSNGFFPQHGGTRIAGATVGGRRTLTFTLAHTGCPPDVVTLRYRVFGLTLSEPLVLRGTCAAATP